MSVIIPTYNCGRYLGAAIESALAQTYRPLEIIVVDDGSTDETPAIVSGYSSSIIPLIHSANRGPSAAVNTGLKAVSGDYVALLDADDLWEPEKIATQVAVFAQWPDLDFVASDCIEFNETRELGRHFDRRGGAIRRYPRRHLGGEVYRLTWTAPLDWLFNVGAKPLPTTWLVRRAQLEAIAPLDEDLKFQDVLTFWCLAKRCRMAYLDRPLARRRIRSDSWGTALDDLAYIEEHLKSLDRLPRRVALEPSEATAARRLRAAYAQAAGYWHYDRYRLVEARTYFRLSVASRISVKGLAYLAASHMPMQVLRQARSLKRRVSAFLGTPQCQEGPAAR